MSDAPAFLTADETFDLVSSLAIISLNMISAIEALTRSETEATGAKLTEASEGIEKLIGQMSKIAKRRGPRPY